MWSVSHLNDEYVHPVNESWPSSGLTTLPWRGSASSRHGSWRPAAPAVVVDLKPLGPAGNQRSVEASDLARRPGVGDARLIETMLLLTRTALYGSIKLITASNYERPHWRVDARARTRGPCAPVGRRCQPGAGHRCRGTAGGAVLGRRPGPAEGR